MIEIMIPTNLIIAGTCQIGIVMGILLVCGGFFEFFKGPRLSSPGESEHEGFVVFCLVVGILSIVCFDGAAALFSSSYMTTPLMGTPCIDGGWGGLPVCAYPTIDMNPYAQTPLHPLTWVWECVCWIHNGLGGAIAVKNI
jgi:hypothetical protein